jgi:hypothetical protein
MEHYLNFISTRKERTLPKEVYKENHHIVPKCYLPQDYENNAENIITLSGREHYIAHMMLWKALGGEMTHSFWRMVHSQQNGDKRRLTSREFERLREDFAKRVSNQFKGHTINSGRIGMTDGDRVRKIHTEEAKKKISEANTGIRWFEEARERYSEKCMGREMSAITKKRISESLKKGYREGRNKKWSKGLTKETDPRLKKMSEEFKGRCLWEVNPMLGKKHSEEYKKKRSKAYLGEGNPFYGRSHTEDTKKKISESVKGSRWMCNPERTFSRQVKPHEIEEFLEKGWTYGRI